MLSIQIPSTHKLSRRCHSATPARNSRTSRALLLPLATLLATSGIQAAPAPGPLPGPETGAVKTTSRGAVSGFVLDARTRSPLSGVKVRVEEQGAFADAGPTVAVTNDAGRYTARALIGRSWSKIDWIRVFTSFPLLLVLQPKSVMMQSRTVLATRLNVRVERDRYLPFVGEVPAERLDARKFSVQLCDVWLAPVGSGLASFSPDQLRREHIEAFTVEPAIARPGDSVTITARARIPFERGGRYRVYFDSSATGLVKTEQRLNPVGPPDPKTGVSTFQRVVKLPRKPSVWTTELSPWISHDYREIPVGWDSKALLQVISDEKDQAVARQVAAGYDQLAGRNPGAAVVALRQAAAGAPDYAPAYRYLGEACQEVGQEKEAATAYQRLVALSPDDLEVALPLYAEALLDSGQSDAAALALDAGEKRSKRVPGPIALARARLFARRGDLHAADEQLARAGRSGRIPRSVQKEIALQRSEAALRAAPDSPDAELALARSLADLDRVEEAERHARRACTLRSDEPWPLIELAGLQRRLGRTQTARAALERALALAPGNGDASLALAELLLASGEAVRARELFQQAAQTHPYDFRSRHGLALAELRVASQTTDDRRQTTVSEAQPVALAPGAWRLSPAPAALEQLRVAAIIGRGKGEIAPGFELPFGFLTTLYFGPKRQTIEGFTRAEAADDFQLVRALERLKAQPEDALALYNAGTALARLGQADMALASLDRAARVQPDLAELDYWRGVALLQLRRPAEARLALEAAMRRNPLHPRAPRLLARLCLDGGEVEQAQTYLAAHRRQWPDESASESVVPE